MNADTNETAPPATDGRGSDRQKALHPERSPAASPTSRPWVLSWTDHDGRRVKQRFVDKPSAHMFAGALIEANPASKPWLAEILVGREDEADLLMVDGEPL